MKEPARNKVENSTKQLRAFGFILGTAFILFSLWPLLVHGEELRIWSAIVASLFILLAVFIPGILNPIYRGWMMVGHVLGWVNTRIILAIGFWGIFTPIGLVMRWIGKDPMRRKWDPNAVSYRVNRKSRPGSHMEKQF